MRGRVGFVDLLRVVAAVQMVQGHTLDALLDDASRRGVLHDAWVVGRGLTAVAFLVAAGMAYHITTLRDVDAYRADADRRRRRVGRATFLIVLGYLLHAPLPMLVGGSAGAAIRGFVIVDVLQCIGVTLLLMECVVVLSRGAARWALAALALSVASLTPALANIDGAGSLVPLTNYLNARAGSLFPLFNWAMHMLGAAAVAGFVLAPGGAGGVALRCLGVGGVSLVAAEVGRAFGADAGVVDHLGRFGWVFVATAGLTPFSAAAGRSDLVRRLASETLFIYAVHLLIVYGDGVGLSTLLGPRLSPASALAVAGVLTVLSAAAALVARARLAPGLVRPSTSG